MTHLMPLPCLGTPTLFWHPAHQPADTRTCYPSQHLDTAIWVEGIWGPCLGWSPTLVTMHRMVTNNCCVQVSASPQQCYRCSVGGASARCRRYFIRRSERGERLCALVAGMVCTDYTPVLLWRLSRPDTAISWRGVTSTSQLPHQRPAVLPAEAAILGE